MEYFEVSGSQPILKLTVIGGEKERKKFLHFFEVDKTARYSISTVSFGAVVLKIFQAVPNPLTGYTSRPKFIYLQIKNMLIYKFCS